MNLESIIIFTDGASKGNPGPGGWGAVLILPEIDGQNQNSELKVESVKSKVVELGGSERITTNNRMEMMAAIEALRMLQLQISNFQFPISKIEIHSDSSYLINGITKWIFGWKRNNWITSQKTEVENRDLWEKLGELVTGLKIDWKYVGGHSGVAGNERCDEIATKYAEQIREGRGMNLGTRAGLGAGRGAEEEKRLFNGKLSDYPVKNILSLDIDVTKAKSKSNGRNRSKAKAYSYLSMIGGKIEKHKTWGECETRVKGKSGVRYKKALSEEEEKEIIEEWRRV